MLRGGLPGGFRRCWARSTRPGSLSNAGPARCRLLAQIGKLPDHHRDPFDRILVCQAIVGGMTLVTPDPWLARYPVPILW